MNRLKKCKHYLFIETLILLKPYCYENGFFIRLKSYRFLIDYQSIEKRISELDSSHHSLGNENQENRK
jgi:hypothetical protein